MGGTLKNLATHCTRIAQERYEPLLDAAMDDASAARAEQILSVIYRVQDHEDKRSVFWNRVVYNAAATTINEHGFVATFAYDESEKTEVNKAHNFEMLRLAETACLLVAEQEQAVKKVTPPALLADKVAGVMSSAYREMKRMNDFKKRGGDTGFIR
jgi:hypothetical protein